MNKDFEARCGINCGKCEHREKFNCQGCMKMEGKLFWGECKVGKCCMDKELNHCGKCSDFVCESLHAFAYDKEQGDNGKRIENLRQRNIEEGQN